MTTQNPNQVTRVLAPITLTHIALQAELLVAEINAMRTGGHDFEQSDVDELHRMVANCLLFIEPGAARE